MKADYLGRTRGFIGGLSPARRTAFVVRRRQQGPADLSGLWEGPGFDLAPAPEKGAPARSRMSPSDIQKPEGDYTNPILQPWAAES